MSLIDLLLAPATRRDERGPDTNHAERNRSPRSAARLGADVRTWVSLLLFIHLFAVSVAVTTYTRPSGVQERLHALFDPYLRNLHLTAFPSSYPFARFHLTHGLATDVNFTVNVNIPTADGKTEKVAIPGDRLQPLVRYRRYQALANAVGHLAQPEGDDSASGILPKAIAAPSSPNTGPRKGRFIVAPTSSPS